nr:MAG TPA: hypothetical protein [Caudoviricetes sp.]
MHKWKKKRIKYEDRTLLEQAIPALFSSSTKPKLTLTI